MLDDIIGLKGTLRLLKAASNKALVNINTFTKTEKRMICQLEENDDLLDMLNDVKHYIAVEEMTFKNVYMKS